MNSPCSCWCGNRVLEYFSADYRRCGLCYTLVLTAQATPRADVGTDGAEECMEWLRRILCYQLPPARVLILADAESGLGAILRWVGFDVCGVERFGEIASGSMDAVVIPDTLQNLETPKEALREYLRGLKPDGHVFLRTSEYRDGAEYSQLSRLAEFNRSRYIFSKSAVTRLLHDLGIEYINFETEDASADYIALAASRRALAANPDGEAALCLDHNSGGRLVLGIVRMCQDLRRELIGQDKRLDLQQRRLDEKDLLLARVRQSYVFRLMRGAGLWNWLDAQPIRGAAAVADAEWQDRNRPAAGELRKVAVDVTPVLPGGLNGGAKVMTLELIRHLGRLAPDIEFILLSSESNHDELAALDTPNVRRVRMSGPASAGTPIEGLALRARAVLKRWLSPEGLDKIARAYRQAAEALPEGSRSLRELSADLLFCPFTAPFFFDPSVPVVSVVYDLQYAYYPQFLNAAEIAERGRNLAKAVRVSSRIVCISDYVRRTLLEKTNVAAERAETIPILLPRRLGAATPEECDATLTSLNLLAGRFLLYPANFWSHKNHELLLTAFGMYLAREERSGLKLVLTGSPGERQDFLRDAACQMGLGEAVVFPGYLPESALSALFQSAMAVIFPSLFEGFGMPLLEGMAAGRPLLCSNRTSLPEVAGDAALFFDPRRPSEIVEVIARVERDSALRAELSRKSTRRVQEFGEPEEMAARYLRIFKRAVQQPVEAPAGIYGVFEDGWLGERFTITFERGGDARTVRMLLDVPGWVSAPEVSVRMKTAGRFKTFAIQPGQTETVETRIGPAAGSIDVFCSPAFKPKSYGLGDDERMLTCRLKLAELVDGDGIPGPLRLLSYGS